MRRIPGPCQARLGIRRRPGARPAFTARRRQPQLEGHRRVEITHPEPVRGDAQPLLHGQVRRRARVVRHVREGAERHQADQFRLAHGDALASRQAHHLLPDPPERRDREVEQVHRDLRAVEILEIEALCLDPRQASAALPDLRGDPPGQPDVGRLEVDVVGDEEGPRSDDGRAAGGVHVRRTGVRFVAGGAEEILQALVLGAADVGQDLVLGTGRGPGVEEDRKLEPRRDALPERPGERHRLVHGGIAERHEGDDVHGPHARVLARVVLHVDATEGEPDGGLHGVGHGLRLAGEGEHGAVVVGVLGAVEQEDAGHGGDDTGELVDDVLPPAFAEVGHALDEPGHAILRLAGSGVAGPGRGPAVRAAASRGRQLHRGRIDRSSASRRLCGQCSAARWGGGRLRARGASHSR